ncbi:hypothetical protein ACFYW1_28120 [Streptomyces sp. NPDC002669]|uniref:hypothetical protein n=1 Tax=Streptomyces sp. NPDC002669 TaxID=3364658 RepID=UPI0036D117B0
MLAPAGADGLSRETDRAAGHLLTGAALAALQDHQGLSLQELAQVVFQTFLAYTWFRERLAGLGQQAEPVKSEPDRAGRAGRGAWSLIGRSALAGRHRGTDGAQRIASRILAVSQATQVSGTVGASVFGMLLAPSRGVAWR